MDGSRRQNCLVGDWRPVVKTNCQAPGDKVRARCACRLDPESRISGTPRQDGA